MRGFQLIAAAVLLGAGSAAWSEGRIHPQDGDPANAMRFDSLQVVNRYLWLIQPDGERRRLAEDGRYVTDDGRLFVIERGKVVKQKALRTESWSSTASAVPAAAGSSAQSAGGWVR